MSCKRCEMMFFRLEYIYWYIYIYLFIHILFGRNYFWDVNLIWFAARVMFVYFLRTDLSPFWGCKCLTCFCFQCVLFVLFFWPISRNTILELHVITSRFTRMDKPNKFFSDNLRGVICYSKANLVIGDPKQDLLKSIFPGGSPWDGFAALFFLTDCQTLIINPDHRCVIQCWLNVEVRDASPFGICPWSSLFLYFTFWCATHGAISPTFFVGCLVFFRHQSQKEGRIVVAVWTLKEIALMRIHGNGDFLWRTALVGELYDLKPTTQLILPPPPRKQPWNLNIIPVSSRVARNRW